MDWQAFIPADAAVCGGAILILGLAAYRFRRRMTASGPAAALFFVLLAVPILAGLARFGRPPAEAGFWQTVAAEAYAMMLGMALPVAVVLVVMERSRRRGEIGRLLDEIEDLRGWKTPEASRRLRGLIRRAIRLRITGIDLTRCHLRGCNLSKAPLSGVRMVGADLDEADLSGCDLTGADLQGAGLRRGVLRSADLRGAVLWGADLRETVLSGALLEGGLLKEADLSGADLSGARLTGAKGLTEAQLLKARSLHKAKLPPALLSGIKRRQPALLRAG